MAITMAIVFAAVFMAQANTILRSSSSTASVGFIFLPLVATLSALQVWYFAAALAYVITAFKIPSPKINLLFLLSLAIVLKCVGDFSAKVKDVMETKLEIYEINLLQSENAIQDKFNNYSNFSKESQPFILEAMALNPFTNSTTLDSIANINDPNLENGLGSVYYFQENNAKGFSVKRLVARHKNTSTDTLKKLSKSSSEYIIADVASNPSTPKAVLDELWKKHGDKIAYSITQNPNADVAIIISLYQKHKDASALMDKWIKANIAKNPVTPETILQELSTQDDWLILQFLIDNEKIPTALLKQLTQHRNQTASAYAKAKLEMREVQR